MVTRNVFSFRNDMTLQSLWRNQQGHSGHTSTCTQSNAERDIKSSEDLMMTISTNKFVSDSENVSGKNSRRSLFLQGVADLPLRKIGMLDGKLAVVHRR